jgi:catechol 2,3-dioxygenase-like lactoylglutathione lyase family enzyme
LTGRDSSSPNGRPAPDRLECKSGSPRSDVLGQGSVSAVAVQVEGGLSPNVTGAPAHGSAPNRERSNSSHPRPEQTWLTEVPRPVVANGVPVAQPSQPTERMVVCYFITSDDVERSRRFYTEVLGGTVVFGPVPTNVALANSFIVINAGGGPTDDKPSVTLETPPDPDRISSFLNIRVTDINAVYAEWSARGAQFLTPPKKHEYETRCYIRDPDGYIIEVGQTTDPQGDWLPADWSPNGPGGQSD